MAITQRPLCQATDLSPPLSAVTVVVQPVPAYHMESVSTSVDKLAQCAEYLYVLCCHHAACCAAVIIYLSVILQQTHNHLDCIYMELMPAKPASQPHTSAIA